MSWQVGSQVLAVEWSQVAGAVQFLALAVVRLARRGRRSTTWNGALTGSVAGALLAWRYGRDNGESIGFLILGLLVGLYAGFAYGELRPLKPPETSPEPGTGGAAESVTKTGLAARLAAARKNLSWKTKLLAAAAAVVALAVTGVLAVLFSFPSPVTLENFDKIRAGKGGMTRSEVAALLGPPAGSGPSTTPGYPPPAVNEVWEGGDGTIRVTFDANGFVAMKDWEPTTLTERFQRQWDRVLGSGGK